MSFSTMLALVWTNLNFSSSESFMQIFFSLFNLVKVVSTYLLHSNSLESEVDERLVKKVLKTLPISTGSSYSFSSWKKTFGLKSSDLHDLILMKAEWNYQYNLFALMSLIFLESINSFCFCVQLTGIRLYIFYILKYLKYFLKGHAMYSNFEI
jgi:hypothetical protein